MKLKQEQKQKLLANASNVYQGYVALDFFKTRSFSTDEGKFTLLEICRRAIQNKELKKNIVLDGQLYELELTEDSDHAYQVSLKRPLHNSPGQRKPITEYDSHEALALISSQHFYLDSDAKSRLHVVNQLTDTIQIGGAKKIDVYRSHLVTLNNIIEKICSEDDISNLLVALATGSGKTYVQALWILVMHLSGNNAIFALPDKLIAQFKNDLRRLLPDNLIDALLTLRDHEDNPQAAHALNALSSNPETSKIIISSSERILDDYYQQLLAVDPNYTFLSFDEQHLLMKSERRRVRLIELSKKMMSMFLTATPNKETYELCGNRPVAIMSSGQKQAAGQGQFPVIFRENARNITDRNDLQDYRFWTADFWQNMFRGFLLRFSNAIQEEQSSSAISIVENLPFYLYRKEDEAEVRWSMQVPMARKMLCIIDDNETLVNFSNALHLSGSNNRDVYRNGNLVNRADIANFFQLPEIDNAIIADDMSSKKRKYHEGLRPAERQIGQNLSEKSLKDQLKDTIFHNMMEYVLTDLTGLDEIEHNRLRKADPKAFQQLIRSQFVARTADYYQAKLGRVIDEAGAREIGILLSNLSSTLKQMVASHSDQDFNDFVDNWALNDAIIRKIQSNNWYLCQQFDAYARQHLMISVMTGMQNAETPIAESKPFLGLKEERYNLYENGVLVEKAKRRKRTALETLNDTSLESEFIPQYLDVSEEVCDNYFRLGFVGVYVSNKKTEGFSDRNLHTLLNLAESTLSSTNNPETVIQGTGRLRGQDETIIPACIHALGREQTCHFDLEHLKADDYYPELFAAQVVYNQQSIAILGQEVGQQIIAWYGNNVNNDETIDQDKLKKQVLKIIAKSLRELNDKNSHHIELSRYQLTGVINAAMDTLNKEIARLNQPYYLPLSIRIMGTVLNFLSETYYSFKRIVPALLRLQHSWFGKRTPHGESPISPTHPDDVYLKVIANTDFKTLIEKISVAREFKDWLARKGKGIETAVGNNLAFYLKKDLQSSLHQHKQELIFPLLANFIVAEKRQMLLKAVKRLPNLIGFLEANKHLIEAVWNNTSDNFEETILQLFQNVPGLEDLTLDDIVNYPQQVKDSLADFEKNPLVLLKQNETLQDQMIPELSVYLRGPFLQLAASLFLVKDYQLLHGILSKDENVEKFLKHLVDRGAENTKLALGNFDVIVAEFKSCFSLSDFASIEARGRECSESLRGEVKTLEENYFAHLQDDKLTEIAQIIQDDLLPCMVNLFPLKSRSLILGDVTLEKIKAVIKTDGMQLMRSMNGAADNDTVVSLFSKLTSRTLPAPLNVAQEAEASKQFLQTKFDAILKTNKLKLGFKKLISPSSWKTTIDKPQYLYDGEIADLIQSDDFLTAISLMLPFTQWRQLKDLLHSNSKATLELSRSVIDLMMESTSQDSMDPARFISLINRHFNTTFSGTAEVLDAGILKLTTLQNSSESNPVSSLNGDVISRFATVSREKLIPLLASFISDTELRGQFLSQLPEDDAAIVQFVFLNKESFEHMQSDNKEQGKAIALDLINRLLPTDSPPLVIGQIDHPQDKGEADGKQIFDDLLYNTLVTYLMSAHFSAVVNKIYNPQDYATLSEFLQDKAKVIDLAKKIIAAGIDTLDEKKIIELLKQEESLKGVKTLDKRMEVFGSFMEELSALRMEALDRDKFSTLITDTMAPVLFHQDFYGLINQLIGFLNEDDLTVMLDAMGKRNPREQAVLLMKFLKTVESQDKAELQKSFITFATGGKVDVDELPIKKVVELMGNVIEEVLDCQCYYNNHDRKGDQFVRVSPKLHHLISEEAKAIRVDASDSFLSVFSRKIFFIQGIRNGLPQSAAISGDSNASRIKVLERINAHILRPLWWGTSLSKAGYAIVKAGRDAAFELRAVGFAILNGLKSLLNLITDDYFTISTRNPVSQDFNDTAFAVAEEINSLVPFDAPKVAVVECPKDVVMDVEQFISKRRNPGFFAAAQESLDADDGNRSELQSKIS